MVAKILKEMVSLMVKQIETDVVGIPYPNDDGSSRLDILEKCRVGDSLILNHAPVKQDKNAVKVTRQTGEQIGWLPREQAKKLAKPLDHGENISAEITYISRWINGARCSIRLTIEK